MPVITLAAPQVQQHLHLTCAQSLARLRLTSVCCLLVQVRRAVAVCGHGAVQLDDCSGPDAKERQQQPLNASQEDRTHPTDALTVRGEHGL